MPDHSFKKVHWIRLGLFLLACTLGIISAFSNNLVLAIIAAVVICCSFWNLKENDPVEEERKISDSVEISSDKLILSITLFVYGVILGIGAAYFSTNIKFNLVSVILWLISIGLLISAGIIFDRAKPFSWIKRIKEMAPKSRRDLYIEISIVLVITGIALALRATHLDLYPPMMHGDEGEMGLESLRVLGIGDPVQAFGLGWGPLPNLFYYLQAGFIYVLGRNEIGLRMISALFGTASIPLVYLIGRKYWGKLAGFMGAWLITVSHFNIHYSRLGVSNIESSFFMILFILLFLAPTLHKRSDQELESGKSAATNFLKQDFNVLPYIAAGLVLGLAQYMYLASRLIALIAIPLYLYLFLRKRINILQIAIVGFTAILVFAPLGMHYLQNPNDFTGRMDTVSIFNIDNIRNNYGQNATLSNSFIPIILNQFKKNLNFFLQSGDGSSFYFMDIPGFDILTAFFFWLGLGVIFARPQRLPELALIIWFVFGIIFGGVITNDSPNGTRLLIVTSSIFIIGGVFIQRTWDILNNFYKKIPNVHLSLAWLTAPVLLCVLITTLGINYNYYFVVYPQAGVNIGGIVITKEIIADAPLDHVYLLGDGDVYVGYGTIRFLAGDGKAEDLKKIDALPGLVNDGKGITVIATGSHYEELNTLKIRYPQGVLSPVNYLGRIIIMKYRIPPLNNN